MSNEENAAEQLSKIQAELISLFGDYCQRSPAPGVAALLNAFMEHRMSLVFTVTSSMEETSLFCGMVAAGEGPDGLQTLFTVHSPSLSASSRGLH